VSISSSPPATGRSRSPLQKRTGTGAVFPVAESELVNSPSGRTGTADPSGLGLISSLVGMGLWSFLEGVLLIANALAILNEDRFLNPRGWSFADARGMHGANTFKGQMIGLIYAAQYMRFPLILLDGITILVKFVTF
uniref:Immediate early response 3-interacting protein 1 n=5 Tax=Triticinae TaxID=1648030 RepID=A0A452Z8D1_AEGTS